MSTLSRLIAHHIDRVNIVLTVVQAMILIRLAIVWHVRTTACAAHVLAPRRISMDHIGNAQGLESMFGRIEMTHQSRKLAALELPIDEE